MIDNNPLLVLIVTVAMGVFMVIGYMFFPRKSYAHFVMGLNGLWLAFLYITTGNILFAVGIGFVSGLVFFKGFKLLRRSL